MTINLIHLLVGILIWGLIAYVVRWALGHFQAPDPIKMIVMVILLILFVVWLLGALGLSPPVMHIGMIATHQLA